MLMPPCCGDGSLQMHQYAAHAIQQLPRYNKDSKDEYMRFIQFYGTHYLHKASFGGQIRYLYNESTTVNLTSNDIF